MKNKWLPEIFRLEMSEIALYQHARDRPDPMLQRSLIIMVGRERHRSRSSGVGHGPDHRRRGSIYTSQGRMWVINMSHPSDSEIYWSRTSRHIKIKRILKVVCQCGVIVLGNC